MEVGIAVSTTLAEGAPYTYYCEPCSPNKGRGYTLSDLQQMKEDGQAAHAAYEVSLMDRVGPDVYFAVKGKQKPADRERLLRTLRRMNETIEGLLDEP